MMGMHRIFAFLALALPTLLSAGAAQALELVFFSRPGCVYCIKWEKDVAPIYGKSAEAGRAPLRHWNLNDGQPPYALKEPVRYTPTFVLVEQGKEVGRITGFINDDMFWGVLGKMLRDIPTEAAKTDASMAKEETK
jgi:thioredoxin-related protein